MRGLVIEEDIRPIPPLQYPLIALTMQVDATGRPLVITQHGKGVGVLLSVRDWQAPLLFIDVLEDIQTSITQLAEGKGLTHDVAKSMVLDSLKN